MLKLGYQNHSFDKTTSNMIFVRKIVQKSVKVLKA